jgi:hypothetical protein
VFTIQALNELLILQQMKKALILLLIPMFFMACKKENLPLGSSETKLTIDKIIGDYKGTFFTCGAIECKEVDAKFKIVKRDSKVYLQFGNIEDEIGFVDNSTTIRSSNITWDSSGINGTYGITGYYKNDSVHVCIGSIYINDNTIYKNSLDGGKQ